MAKIEKVERTFGNPFENYTFDEANKAFAELKKSIEKTLENRKFIEGDDWNNGKGWVGPHFDSNGRGAKVSKFLKDEIERDFASKGDIKSAVRRHRRGVIGRVPGWTISSRNAPSDPNVAATGDEETRIGEAEQILNEFWKNSRVHTTGKEAVEDYLVDGINTLRLFFVHDEFGEFEIAETISDAVKMIHLFREKPESGCVVVDKRTLKRASFYRYEDGGAVYIEMTYVDDDGGTVFKKFASTESEQFAKENMPTLAKYHAGDSEAESDIEVYPFGGKLLLFQMKATPFVSPAMRSMQKLVNKGFTMMSHNLDEDGFRRKKILNGLPPGKFQKGEDGSQVYVPDADGEVVSAGSVSYTSGLPTVKRDKEGNLETGYTTPSVHESQPIDITTYTETIRVAGEGILEEADQMHIIISGESEPSGESRIQAKDDFRQSLEDTKSDFDDCFSEIFEAVLAVVAYLMDQDGRYDDLQVSVSANLNTGPKSIAERERAQTEAEGGFRSDESAMEEMNINDPDAMKKKITAEAEEDKKNGLIPRRKVHPQNEPNGNSEEK